jgi:hypothetical protein
LIRYANTVVEASRIGGSASIDLSGTQRQLPPAGASLEEKEHNENGVQGAERRCGHHETGRIVDPDPHDQPEDHQRSEPSGSEG